MKFFNYPFVSINLPGLLLVCVCAPAGAQIAGRVADVAGNPLAMASVTVAELNTGVVCDEHGVYRISGVKPGTYSVSAGMVGYKKQTTQVTVQGTEVTLNFLLAPDAQHLNEVTVTAEKSTVQKVREQAFAVSSIDVAPLQNLNLDVNAVLNRSTGIRIRQDGGLGSDFSFSLNGFTGNQVRFFIDGISSDFLGSAMRFNNIPVNMIDRIEVYKGVVPVNLGADALGGAVNIVTSDNTKDFLDISYTVGSFNTHQAALASRVMFKNHFVVNTSGFFNYSDNSYPVDVSLQGAGNAILPSKPFKLFNEAYRSSSATLEAGVVNTAWADRFLIGIIVAENKKNLQRGRAMVLNPAGEVYTTNQTVTPTLKYSKKNLAVQNLSLNASAIYAYTRAMVVDTSSRIYSWDGSYTVREFGSTAGELNWYKTMFRFTDQSAFGTATLEYVPWKHHTFTLNNTYSYFRRIGSDPVASQYSSSIAFSDPNTLAKNISGVSYKLGLFDNRWNTTVFAKFFHMDARVQVQNPDTEEYERQRNRQLRQGAGIATALWISPVLQLKSSYERTSRLPETYELFGNGLLLQPNVELKPERSHNFNFNVLYAKRLGSDHRIGAEGGFVYRLPQDKIQLVAIGVLSQYQNLRNTRVLATEGSVRYSYKRWLNLELNATYQNMRNNNKTIDSYPDPLYNDRIPNDPYLFGNAILGFVSSEFGQKKWQVGFNWTTLYVEKFYLRWPSQGGADSKYVIPMQLSHDASVSVSALSGRYNLSFSCWNLADSKLYDNFKVQRPGRSFNVKLRFYISRFKD